MRFTREADINRRYEPLIGGEARRKKEKPKGYLGLKILWNSEIIHARWLDDAFVMSA